MSDKKKQDAPYCGDCLRDLEPMDADPNGRIPARCLQCEAEQNHDFTKYPKARFNRYGQRVMRVNGKDVPV